MSPFHYTNLPQKEIVDCMIKLRNNSTAAVRVGSHNNLSCGKNSIHAFLSKVTKVFQNSMI